LQILFIVRWTLSTLCLFGRLSNDSHIHMEQKAYARRFGNTKVDARRFGPDWMRGCGAHRSTSGHASIVLDSKRMHTVHVAYISVLLTQRNDETAAHSKPKEYVVCDDSVRRYTRVDERDGRTRRLGRD